MMAIENIKGYASFLTELYYFLINSLHETSMNTNDASNFLRIIRHNLSYFIDQNLEFFNRS